MNTNVPEHSSTIRPQATLPPAKSNWARQFMPILLDPRPYAWIGLVIAILCVFRAIPSKPTYMWVSSDTLWPVHLFIDVFAEGFLFSGWRFSIAPCWAPDIVIVGLCYLFIRNPLGATLMSGAVQLLILVAGFCLCWRSLRIRHLVLAETLTICSAILVTLWIAFHTDVMYPGFYQLLLPQTHVGNLIMQVYTMWLTALIMQPLSRVKRSLTMAGLMLVCFLSGLSNLMYFPHTIAPLSVAIALLVLGRAVTLRTAAVPLVIGWLATAAGAIAYRLSLPAMGVMDQSRIGSEAWLTALRAFDEGLRVMFARNDFQHIAATLWLTGCIVAGGVLLWRLCGAANAHTDTPIPTAIFLIAAAVSSVLGPITVIVGGSYGLTVFNNYIWTLHYLHPTFLLPLFAWPVLIGFLPQFRFRGPAMHAATAVTAMAVIGIPTAALVHTPKPPVSIYDYRPEYVSALDEQAVKYGIKYGVAGYWQARVITLLSKTKLRVYPVDGLLNPFTIVSNTEWYNKSFEDRAHRPCFSFVVLNDPLWKIERSTVVRVAGEPTHDLNVAGTPVMVYSNGAQPHATPSCVLNF